MITVAVTGGIGAGKSTVSRRLAELGAVVIDSDRLAREVVAPGSDGLAEIAETFGPGVLAEDGSLLRPALAAIVFGDPAARARLEAITHPRVRARFAEERAAAGPDAIVVNDIPLLVALPVAAGFHLVLSVRADPETRVARLVDRGLTEADARARIAAQITDAERDPLTDVWLDNDGDPSHLISTVDDLWRDRLVPFERNVRLGRVATPAETQPTTTPGAATEATARRLAARIGAAVPGSAVTVLEPTAGATGPVRLRAATVDPLLLPELTAIGFPPIAPDGRDDGVGNGGGDSGGNGGGDDLVRRHGAADPGRPVDVDVVLGLR